MNYLEDVRNALLSRCPALLMDWLPGGRIQGGYYTCGSLVGGQGDSLKVNMKRGLWRDWADPGQRDGDLISLYAALKAIPYKDALHSLADIYQVAKPPSTSKSKDWQVIVPVPESAYKCSLDGNPLLPEIPFLAGNAGYWPYFNADGQLTCFRVRMDRPGNKKDIFPVCFCRHRINAETSWQLREPPEPFSLFDLPSVISAQDGVLVVEGEKTAVAGQRTLPRWAVTTWPGGVQRVRKADWSSLRALTGIKIVLWPDNDRPGIEAMSEVARLLDRTVRVVTLDPSWPKGYDLADLEADGWTTDRIEAWIAQNSVELRPEPAVTRPEVNLTGHDPFVQMQSLYRAIREVEAEIFNGSSGVVYVRKNIYGLSELQTMQGKEFADWTAGHLDCYHHNGNGKARTTVTERLASATVFNAPGQIPVLKRFTDVPMFTSSGKQIIESGYDSESNIFASIPEGFDPEMELEQAWSLIDDLLKDFPFESESDKTAAVSYPLTAMCRDLIDGPTPLFRFEAPTPGTGKSLLCRALSEVITPYPSEGNLPDSEEETKKFFTTKLMLSPAVICLDNVYDFKRSVLIPLLTADIWEDRILGGNKLARIPVRNLWAATLNNPVLSREMFRRSVRVRLNAKMENPEGRAGWRHDPLMSYVRSNRAILVSALWAVAKNGVGETASATPAMGMYESWVRIIAPILEYGSYGGFLVTMEEDRRLSADEEAESLRGFIEQWKNRFGGQEVHTKELAELASSNSGLTVKRNKEGKISATSMGKFLQRHRGAVISGATIWGPYQRREGSVFWLRGDVQEPQPTLPIPNSEENTGF